MDRLLATCLVLVCFAFPAQGGDEAPTKKIPELAVLDHYLGEWDTKITTKDFPFTGGKASAKKTLDGRFVQQSGKLLGKDAGNVLEVTTLMTYDLKKNVYRSWTFVSDGSTTQSEGTWNAKTKTMTSVSQKDENGVSSTTTADFSVAGVETWQIVVTDAAGKVVGGFRGINTRRKK